MARAAGTIRRVVNGVSALTELRIWRSLCPLHDQNSVHWIYRHWDEALTFDHHLPVFLDSDGMTME